MCSRYQFPYDLAGFEDYFGRPAQFDLDHVEMWPYYQGKFYRRPESLQSGDHAVPKVELVAGRWGMIAPFTSRDGLDQAAKLSTFNARDDRVRKAHTFRNAWSKGQHCIVPASAFYEPDWRSGRHVPTRFTSADGGMFGIAGLWDRYRDTQGVLQLAYTMMTTDANLHPLLRNCHRPESDKRMLVLLPRAQFSEWLDAPAERSMEFMTQYPADRLVAMAEKAAPKPRLKSKTTTPAPGPEPRVEVQKDLFS